MSKKPGWKTVMDKVKKAGKRNPSITQKPTDASKDPSKDQEEAPKRPLTADLMVKVEPLTENQEKIFKAWDEGRHMFIYGAAGTGKDLLCPL